MTLTKWKFSNYRTQCITYHITQTWGDKDYCRKRVTVYIDSYAHSVITLNGNSNTLLYQVDFKVLCVTCFTKYNHEFIIDNSGHKKCLIQNPTHLNHRLLWLMNTQIQISSTVQKCHLDLPTTTIYWRPVLHTVITTCSDDRIKTGWPSWVSSFGTTISTIEEIETLKAQQKLMKFSRRESKLPITFLTCCSRGLLLRHPNMISEHLCECERV